MNKSKRAASKADAALDAMGADDLRAVVREVIPTLDESSRARLVDALVDRAARGGSGWVPEGPGDADVGEVEAFARAARRVGHAEPSEVDDYLRLGSSAFLAGDYEGALRILRALLTAVGSGDVYLGQEEMLEEVLSVDLNAVAAQYAVSAYVTAPPRKRAEAVLAAVDDARGAADFWEPLRELERAAREPLPGFEEFLADWRAVVARRAAERRDSDWDRDEDRWLREVALRARGPAGLAEVARASGRAEDLRAWCGALIRAGDWDAALAACEEAAATVRGGAHARGAFLDGAALAARELGEKDLPGRLERAWREAPSAPRLRRWLGSSKSKRALRERVARALAACPAGARAQRALLHVLGGDLAPAAKLLASAPGLGWSSGDHPGHLLFPLFAGMLGGRRPEDDPAGAGESAEFGELADLGALGSRDGPRLATPGVAALVDLAGVAAPADARARAAVIAAMRTAAEKRLAGVAEKQRRRHYAHAASLALACAEVDRSPGAARWLAALRGEYRRYPALARELGRG